MTFITLAVILTVFLVPFMMIIVWYFGTINNVNRLLSVLPAIPCFFVLMWLVYFIITKIIQKKAQMRRQKAVTSGEIESLERSTNDFKEQLKSSLIQKPIKEIMREIETIKLNEEVPEEKCKISRSKFSKGEEISRCPFCKSVFKKEYLIEWLLKNEICPVCRKRIIVRLI